VRTRLLAGIATLGVASALVTVPALPAGAASAAQNFEGFSLGSVNGQGGWQILGSSYDVAVADTSAVYGGALGTRALRISNAVTSGSFGDQEPRTTGSAAAPASRATRRRSPSPPPTPPRSSRTSSWASAPTVATARACR
jgi:hypothetical protein